MGKAVTAHKSTGDFSNKRTQPKMHVLLNCNNNWPGAQLPISCSNKHYRHLWFGSGSVKEWNRQEHKADRLLTAKATAKPEIQPSEFNLSFELPVNGE